MFNKVWPLARNAFGSSSSSSCGNATTINSHSLKENIIDDLHSEVQSAGPNARLSTSLRSALERLDFSERQKIVSVTRMDGCSPLFIACKKGNLEIVQYLLEMCGADVEQRGVYEVIDEKASHRVTPLWCASVAGKLNVVKCLVKHGANVNAVSDTGSSPVRSACFMTHLDIVQYLVEEGGADIELPNYNGGTCLINSVQSVQLCEYLLSHGASVNAKDIQLKTALHYAIQEHRFETTRLLLEHGADSFQKNRYGDDSLQTAALKGAATIFNYLVRTVNYPLDKRVDMLELIGSTFIDEHHDIQMALTYWREAADLREANGLYKPMLGYAPLYAYVDNPSTGKKTTITEFQNKKELESISTDVELMRMNSLLIAERILGSSHKDVIFRIMYRGAAYADLQMYSVCISLWIYALELRVKKDSILYGDSCFTALALIRLYLDLDRSSEYHNSYYNMYRDDRIGGDPLTFSVLMRTYVLLIEQLPDAARLIKIRPQLKRQLESYDRCIRCSTHLLYLLLKVVKTKEERRQLAIMTENLVSMDPRMSYSGDSLLHMVVSKGNVVRSHFFQDERQVSVFPNQDVVKFLVECGANVNSLNDAKATPLHAAVQQDNYNEIIVKHLVEEGSHVDLLDKNNKSPITSLMNRPYAGFQPLQHLTLKCLSARIIGTKYMNISSLDGQIPKELIRFVNLHASNHEENWYNNSYASNRFSTLHYFGSTRRIGS